MAKKKLNVALIGTKFMGKTHSNAFRQVNKFFDLPYEVVPKVICGRNPKETQDAADTMGWEEASTNWEEVVQRKDIDIVDVSSPGNLHAPMAIAAAKAGKHILCEKPLANTTKESKEMLKAVEKAGVSHMCGFSYRFAPAVATIKNLIQSGKLGDIFHFRAAYQQDWIVDPEFPLVWRLQKDLAGSGALGDIGAHIIDMCHNLIGPIAEVSSAMQTFVTERPIAEADTGITKSQGKTTKKRGKVTVDDAAIFLARFAGKPTLATFEATRFAPGRRNHHVFEVYGSKGSVVWNLENMNVFQYYNSADPETLQGFRTIHATDPGHPYAGAWWPSAHIIGYEHLFVHEVYDFVSQLGKKKVTYPTFADGVQCQLVLDAVEKSAKTRKWEAVK
ncbi:MAG: oxidoreductase [Candidatus Hydrogenedentota bacterium]